MSDKKRIKLAFPVASALDGYQSTALNSLAEYGELKASDWGKDSRVPSLDSVISSLCAYGHYIYVMYDLDEFGEEVRGSRVYHLDDCTFVTERRLGLPGAVSITNPDTDFSE